MKCNNVIVLSCWIQLKLNTWILLHKRIVCCKAEGNKHINDSAVLNHIASNGGTCILLDIEILNGICC